MMHMKSQTLYVDVSDVKIKIAACFVACTLLLPTTFVLADEIEPGAEEPTTEESIDNPEVSGEDPVNDNEVTPEEDVVNEEGEGSEEEPVIEEEDASEEEAAVVDQPVSVSGGGPILGAVRSVRDTVTNVISRGSRDTAATDEGDTVTTTSSPTPTVAGASDSNQVSQFPLGGVAAGAGSVPGYLWPLVAVLALVAAVLAVRFARHG